MQQTQGSAVLVSAKQMTGDQKQRVRTWNLQVSRKGRRNEMLVSATGIYQANARHIILLIVCRNSLHRRVFHMAIYLRGRQRGNNILKMLSIRIDTE